jgi:hypothetical protein
MKCNTITYCRLGVAVKMKTTLINNKGVCNCYQCCGAGAELGAHHFCRTGAGAVTRGGSSSDDSGSKRCSNRKETILTPTSILPNAQYTQL